MQILDKRWRQLADRERALLEHLIEFLQGFGAPPEDASLVRRKLEDLEELFLLVIVGEFNSGKPPSSTLCSGRTNSPGRA